MPRLGKFAVVLAAVCGVARPAVAEVGFNRDVRPIFNGHCTACHGGVKQAGGISFVYPEQVLPPDGWVIEPGEPEMSILLDRVTETDPEFRMPPPDHGPALSETEVDLLRQWIAEGAHWEDHWAYRAPTAPDPPATDAAWPRSEIDRFVLRRLQEEGLAPSPDAGPRRWLRRVSLDLIGLPPSPEEQEAFLAAVAQDGEAAYADTVDRLLASPHFGERWASVWLDQIRYADSRGLGLDRPRDAWPYRDWVIDALNADLPFDEFTIKQLAGDLLPNAKLSDLVATAAHRLTQTNEEGGTDDEEFRVAAVLDRVNTTWQAWQGVTFGCVQCHSHPYDPFRHDEYYRFAAFFNNTADSDTDQDLPTVRTPIDRDRRDEADRLRRRIDALEEQIWLAERAVTDDPGAWRPVDDVRARSNKSTEVRVEPLGDHQQFRTVGTVERDTDLLVRFAAPEGLRRVTALRITGAPRDPEKALADSEWGFVWSQVLLELIPADAGKPRRVELARVVADEPHPFVDPQKSLERSSPGFGAYTRIHHPRTATFVLAEPLELPEGARLRVTLKHRLFVQSAYPLVTSRGHVELSGEARMSTLVESAELREQREQLAALRAELDAIPAVATPVLAERPADLRRPQHVFIRGLFLDKGEPVEAGTPESFPPLGAEGEPDRLDLARWLVSDENPLTARVTVNRFWARLFGVGLVASEEDFGSSGDEPSHPELLDHLAVRFQNDFDWSVKRLLREITLSRTYRQTSRVDKALYQRDPDNRLLARGPRVRLPAETIRDQALAVSGLLDRTPHGPPVRPPIAAGVWDPFDGGDKWPATEPGDPERYRRSVYTYTKRSIPYPMFATFDSPSREFCTPRRLRSNTPLQALELLNGETMVECAAALGDRMRSHGDTPAEQVRYGFAAAVCRPPTEREEAILLELREESGGDAGLATVAAALLNLDEFVMK